MFTSLNERRNKNRNTTTTIFVDWRKEPGKMMSVMKKEREEKRKSEGKLSQIRGQSGREQPDIATLQQTLTQKSLQLNSEKVENVKAEHELHEKQRELKTEKDKYAALVQTYADLKKKVDQQQEQSQGLFKMFRGRGQQEKYQELQKLLLDKEDDLKFQKTKCVSLDKYCSDLHKNMAQKDLQVKQLQASVEQYQQQVRDLQQQLEEQKQQQRQQHPQHQPQHGHQQQSQHQHQQRHQHQQQPQHQPQHGHQQQPWLQQQRPQHLNQQRPEQQYQKQPQHQHQQRPEQQYQKQPQHQNQQRPEQQYKQQPQHQNQQRPEQQYQKQPQHQHQQQSQRQYQQQIQRQHQQQPQHQQTEKQLPSRREVSSALPLMSTTQAVRTYLENFKFVSQRTTSADDIMNRSFEFPLGFPVTAMCCANLLSDRPDVDKENLSKHANSAYPLVHEAALYLYINFLEYKKYYGTNKERELYANMGLSDFVQRLLLKRAAVFSEKTDKYLLMNGEKGFGNWESIGLNDEREPLTLANCLSYDEIKLSAFLSVSSHSFFINDGRRDNKAIPESYNSNFQKQGVIIGLIGARLEKPDVMDWQELVISQEQNTTAHGYGSQKSTEKYHWRRLWANFYGVAPNLPLYGEAIVSSIADRYTNLGRGMLFDNEIYKKRVALSAETLLLEADSRAAACGTTAYVNVVGVGLGIWRVSSEQDALFLDSFMNCVRRLTPVLTHISDVHFLWFNVRGRRGDPSDVRREDGTAVRIHFSNGSPHDQLMGEHAGKLLVVSYAWDGNALPGNEFWTGALATSGDPAAACSTQIAEFHNPHINRDRVKGSNLHVATTKWGVLHLAEYIQRKR